MDGAHVGKKCLTHGLVEVDMCLSKERHYNSTVIILYKQNVLCAGMMGGGGASRGKRLRPWRPPPPPPLWRPSVTPP